MSCGKCIKNKKKDSKEIKELRKLNPSYSNLSAKDILALENIKKQINRMKTPD
jgi:hypothetical protein